LDSLARPPVRDAAHGKGVCGNAECREIHGRVAVPGEIVALVDRHHLLGRQPPAEQTQAEEVTANRFGDAHDPIYTRVQIAQPRERAQHTHVADDAAIHDDLGRVTARRDEAVEYRSIVEEMDDV